jgi:hypothetical protein
MYPYDKLTKQFPWFDLFVECPPSWFDTIFSLLREIDDCYFDLGVNVQITPLQLKEKYSQFRFYYGFNEESRENFEQIRNMVDRYEKMSYTEFSGTIKLWEEEYENSRCTHRNACKGEW